MYKEKYFVSTSAFQSEWVHSCRSWRSLALMPAVVRTLATYWGIGRSKLIKLMM